MRSELAGDPGFLLRGTHARSKTPGDEAAPSLIAVEPDDGWNLVERTRLETVTRLVGENDSVNRWLPERAADRLADLLWSLRQRGHHRYRRSRAQAEDAQAKFR